MALHEVTIPTIGIKIQTSNTKAFIGTTELGTGLLCVAESNLIWKMDNQQGLCLEYPHIALHAVSKDLNAFPHECLYVMMDRNILNEEGENEEEQEESTDITELRFVPEDKTLLNQLFLAMNECQALYPDESMSGDEGKDEDSANEENEGEFEDDDVDEIEHVNGNGTTCINPNEVELSARGQQILRRLNINYQTHDELGNENEHEADTLSDNAEQYEDA